MIIFDVGNALRGSEMKTPDSALAATFWHTQKASNVLNDCSGHELKILD